MFLPFFLISIPLLCGASAAGSFPKPLSGEEEQYYLSLFQNGTESEKAIAKQELILHNLRLVAHIAKKYHLLQKDTEELISIGTVGLIKAILSYNPQKSIRLATYASRCIENTILSSMRFPQRRIKKAGIPLPSNKKILFRNCVCLRLLCHTFSSCQCRYARESLLYIRRKAAIPSSLCFLIGKHLSPAVLLFPL